MAGMKKQWIRIDISCEAEVADELAFDVAEAFGTGVEITGEGIRLYWEDESFSKNWTHILDRLLSGFRQSSELTFPITYSYSTIAEEDWTERWKDDFKPLRVGKRFVVSPTWETVKSDSDDIVIRIDPGRAFGTGHHETTRLCLEWLEEGGAVGIGAAPNSLLDVGTGSGILAIVASLLGFARVLAVDTDPEAIEVAEENMRINGLTGRIKLRLGTVTGESRFDVVLANIQANPLIGMAGNLAKSLAEAGRLVLSGILVEQKDRVRKAYEGQGLELIEERIAGEWCLLVFGFMSEVA